MKNQNMYVISWSQLGLTNCDKSGQTLFLVQFFALEGNIEDHCFMGKPAARDSQKALANRVVLLGNKHIQGAVGKGQYPTNEAKKIYNTHSPISGSRWLLQFIL